MKPSRGVILCNLESEKPQKLHLLYRFWAVFGLGIDCVRVGFAMLYRF
jgi:hypothetical protein